MRSCSHGKDKEEISDESFFGITSVSFKISRLLNLVHRERRLKRSDRQESEIVGKPEYFERLDNNLLKKFNMHASSNPEA
jgi:hypothetical protein